MLFRLQSADVSVYQSDLQTDKKNPVGKDDNTEEDDTIPGNSSCYKMTKDAKPNPEVVEPIGKDFSFTCSCLFSYIFLKP